jgi:glycosyltransferase involved in cell wall biosynthesis
MRSLRIAMIGQRGIPATFGGIEHHVEELGAQLAGRGHEVTVYTRPNYVDRRVERLRGMRPRYVPTVGTKHLDAIVHSALSTIDAVGHGADILHYHAVGPGIPAVIPRYLSRAKVVLTVHGLDAERAKWGGAARRSLEAATWLSARVPDETVVVSRDLERHYLDRYGRRTTFIPNGVVDPVRRSPEEIVRRFGLRGDDYILFVGRLVPEKAPDLLLRAFRDVETDRRLVIAGGSSFTDDYVRSLEALARSDPRVVMAGYAYGAVLDELYSNASVFVLPSSLEGLPLTLLEAASYGVPLVVSDIPPHLEIVGTDAPGHRIFASGDAAALTRILADALHRRDDERLGAAALMASVRSTYRWDVAGAKIEQVYLGLLRKR